MFELALRDARDRMAVRVQRHGLARGRRGVWRARVIVVHVGLEGIRVLRLALAHHLDEVVDDDRVELRALAGLQLRERELRRAPLAIGPRRRHRVIGVTDGHDAGMQRDVLTRQPVRVTAAVVPLVVMQDDVQDLPEGLDWLQDARAQDWVHAHDQLLVLVEFPSLRSSLSTTPILPTSCRIAARRSWFLCAPESCSMSPRSSASLATDCEWPLV